MAHDENEEAIEGEVLDRPTHRHNTNRPKYQPQTRLLGARTWVWLSILILLMPVALLVLLIVAAEALSGAVLPILKEWVTPVFIATFTALAIIGHLSHRYRQQAARWLYVGSFLAGLLVWIIGFMVTLEYWGIFAVIIGIILLGIGVVPVGILAALTALDWLVLLQFAVLLLLIPGLRHLAFILAR